MSELFIDTLKGHPVKTITILNVGDGIDGSPTKCY